uniref:Olfactory receptor 1L6 n=3 Tax=Homo sapiens TaxID=9606 RepID=OR1L6_HUMAN|nr:RecName: Full=Olfactory receptor 1L6; AltName: Full=Olfactory receptor 1L7; AltName: Full=Olfactory receptor OR9-30 [Homo sapiens]DAA04632.1 TPA_inf: olfactory receptor OR9-30 [Homo sapiens]
MSYFYRLKLMKEAVLVKLPFTSLPLLLQTLSRKSRDMEIKNYSSSTSGFILLGLSSNPQLQKPLFAIFLIMYLLAAVGNVLIIPAIYSDPRLHTPMYFFLSNLSFMDICFTTVIVPKMLVNFLSETKVISYVGCLAQMYFFMAFGNTDSYLLASMAIDRLVAICNPLHYDVVMKPRHCLLMLLGSCSISHLHSLFRVLLMSRLSFCASHIIKHFFCDTQPVLKLSCSDTSSSQMVVMTETLAVIVTPFLCIIFSYLRIMVTVLRIPSAAGKWKAFSTCGSHLTAVALFYGSIIYVYFRPLSMYSVVRDRVATVMYTVVTPMLNPFIYSLRNKDMKRGLKKLQDRIYR